MIISCFKKVKNSIANIFAIIQAINCSLVGVDDLAENWEKMKSSYAKYFSDSQYSVHIVKAGKVCQVIYFYIYFAR